MPDRFRRITHHINDSAETWATMWQEQVSLGLIPYYMFIARDTGAQHYFSLPLVECYRIFKQAYQQVGGICRTVRGPSMSTYPGKVQILGTPEIRGEKTICLRFIQGRNPSWVQQPFFAKYNTQAKWLNELQPAFTNQFFFEQTQETPLAL